MIFLKFANYSLESNPINWGENYFGMLDGTSNTIYNLSNTSCSQRTSTALMIFS
jgi:hypothetical protein